MAFLPPTVRQIDGEAEPGRAAGGPDGGSARGVVLFGHWKSSLHTRLSE